MSIHPTAIVHSSAKIHASAEIGPFCIIEENVEIGEGCWLESNVRIQKNSILGKNNRIFNCAVVGGEPQDLGFDRSLPTFAKLGDGNVLREGVMISRATHVETPTTLGNNNYLMGNVHFGHDSVMENNNILTQACILAGHIHVGNRVFISGLAGVHQFCRIGDNAMLAGLAKVSKDCPPYCTVDGNPAAVIGLNVVGLRRSGFSSEAREHLRKAYKLMYYSGLLPDKAIEAIEAMNSPYPEVKTFAEFFRESKRGVTDRA